MWVMPEFMVEHELERRDRFGSWLERFGAFWIVLEDGIDLKMRINNVIYDSDVKRYGIKRYNH